MKYKKVTSALLATSLFISALTPVVAAKLNFKIATVDNDNTHISAKGMIESVDIDNKAPHNSQIAKMEDSMNACAMQIMSSNMSLAEQDCTYSVELFEKYSGRGRQFKFLKSLAYSNLGIARYSAGDVPGAFRELTSALLVDNNTIVMNNLKRLNTESLNNKISSKQSVAD